MGGQAEGDEGREHTVTLVEEVAVDLKAGAGGGAEKEGSAEVLRTYLALRSPCRGLA